MFNYSIARAFPWCFLFTVWCLFLCFFTFNVVLFSFIELTRKLNSIALPLEWLPLRRRKVDWIKKKTLNGNFGPKNYKIQAFSTVIKQLLVYLCKQSAAISLMQFALFIGSQKLFTQHALLAFSATASCVFPLLVSFLCFSLFFFFRFVPLKLFHFSSILLTFFAWFIS